MIETVMGLVTCIAMGLLAARWSGVAGWFKRRGRPKQTTFCYCPQCGLELCGSGPEVKCWHDEHGQVNYVCTCGQLSRWDFDLPVPLLLYPMRRNGV